MEEMTQTELDSRVQEQDQELTEMKQPEAPKEPKIVMRGNRVFIHTVFKLEVKTMKKNLA